MTPFVTQSVLVQLVASLLIVLVANLLFVRMVRKYRVTPGIWIPLKLGPPLPGSIVVATPDHGETYRVARVRLEEGNIFFQVEGTIYYMASVTHYMVLVKP